MKISGHRTESAYRRYATVSEADVLEAAKKIESGKRAWAENRQSLNEMQQNRALTNPQKLQEPRRIE